MEGLQPRMEGLHARMEGLHVRIEGLHARIADLHVRIEGFHPGTGVHTDAKFGPLQSSLLPFERIAHRQIQLDWHDALEAG